MLAVLLIFSVVLIGCARASAQEFERLFEQYTRLNLWTNYKTVGTGLGMSITKSLIDMMQGSITIESEPGKGTFVSACIPQVIAKDSILGKEQAENFKNFSNFHDKDIKKAQIFHEQIPNGSILIVDDLKINLYVAKCLMEPYGMSIETATSGFQAIEKIQGGAVYDIVFMDHMMPEMDGIETVKQLRDGGYNKPIVALTV